MADVLGADVEARLRELLHHADLEQVSSKKIRRQLEAEFSTDLSAQKQQVDDLIMAELDKLSTPVAPVPAVNDRGNNNHEAEDSASSANEQPSPLRASRRKGHHHQHHHHHHHHHHDNHKRFKTPDTIDDDDEDLNDLLAGALSSDAISAATDGESDETLAQRLQDEEQRRAQRQTRTRNVSSSRSRSSSASSAGKRSAAPSQAKTKKPTGFQTPMVLSGELAGVVNAAELPRSQVIKQLWVYIKEHNLQDPADKRIIVCDDKLELIFRKPRVQMFKMNKDLERHMKSKDDIVP